LALNFFAWKEVFVLASPRYLEVSFLAVGQGDSEFIKTPQGHQILIDGGPGLAVLEKISKNLPFWDKKIDLVILTHPEKDHMQGLISLLQRYKADYILWTGIKKDSSEYLEWLKILEKQKLAGVKIIIAEAGQTIKAGEILIETVYPYENLNGKIIKDANESSVVNKIVYGENLFLFTGDISIKTEKDIINSDKNISADVLKIAHHGSKYSTSQEFLQAVNPEIAVIEVGKNSYGHPTSETLQRLENFGIQIKRTDKDGDVKILSDGKNIKLEK
jgi:competence protein ComEC